MSNTVITIIVPELVIDDVITLPAHIVEGEPGFIEAVYEILSDPDLNERLKHKKYLCDVLRETVFGNTNFYEDALWQTAKRMSLDGHITLQLIDVEDHPLSHLINNLNIAETQEMRDLRIQWARHTAKHIKDSHAI